MALFSCPWGFARRVNVRFLRPQPCLFQTVSDAQILHILPFLFWPRRTLPVVGWGIDIAFISIFGVASSTFSSLQMATIVEPRSSPRLQHPPQHIRPFSSPLCGISTPLAGDLCARRLRLKIGLPYSQGHSDTFPFDLKPPSGGLVFFHH